MDDRDRIDEREWTSKDESCEGSPQGPPDPRDRLDERVEQIGPPPPREPEVKVERKRRHPTDDLPPAA